MTTAPPPIPLSPASPETDSFEVRILALRAELLHTLTPGIMHHLANAGQGLIAAKSSPHALEQVSARLEKARRIIGTLVGDLAVGGTTGSGDPCASVDEILAEVGAWQSCQITLPRVRVVFDPHVALPTARIRADHLRDALAAIVTNAKEAMAGSSAGEVHVSAEASPGWITITVVDDGPGIDLTILARLFEPHNSTKKDGSHLGLGLSVARELLTRAGGELGVTASDGQPHTRIWMRIPTRPPDAGAGPGFAASDLGGTARPALTDTSGQPGRVRAAA